MILTTLEELQQYFPAHSLTDINTLTGAIDNSEHDFLLPALGQSLYELVSSHYEELKVTENDVTPIAISDDDPYKRIIVLSQRAVAYDAVGRIADLMAVSLNNSGINSPFTGDFATASKDAVDNFKRQSYKEAHSALNRLLLHLEELARSGEEEEIVEAWKASRYYYYAAGILINTAEELQHFVDIYDNREKFINLLPDLRYIHEEMLAYEIGEDLLADLTGKMQDGTGNDIEKATIKKLQRLTALYLEDRSKMFKRPEAKDEAKRALMTVREYIKSHIDSFDADAVKTSPLYVKEESQTSEQETLRFKNNQKCNKLFAMPFVS